jgi:hypothetical protein
MASVADPRTIRIRQEMVSPLPPVPLDPDPDPDEDEDEPPEDLSRVFILNCVVCVCVCVREIESPLTGITTCSQRWRTNY